MSQSELAKQLSAEEGKPVTQQQVDNLENGQGFTLTRRRALVSIFGVHAEVFGVSTLSQLGKRSGKGSTQKSGVDIEEYQAHLSDCLKAPVLDTLLTLSPRLDTLYYELPHAKGPERKAEVKRLLCRYHYFIANQLLDQQEHDYALHHLDYMLDFAENLQEVDLIALGWLGQGRIYSHLQQIPEALNSYEKILLYERKLPPSLKGTVLRSASNAYARKYTVTQDPTDRSTALSLMKRAENVMRSNPTTPDSYLTDFCPIRYQIALGEVLITVGYSRDGLRELSSVHDPYPDGLRNAFSMILQAQGELNIRQYPAAVACANAALPSVLRHQSAMNITRLQSITKRLLASPYKDDDDVARLEHMLGVRA